MKRIFVLCWIVTVALFQVAAAQQEDNIEDVKNTTITKLGQTVPDFTATTIDSVTINTADLRGKVFLITLFVTWCPTCNAEIPHLEKDMWQRFKDKKFMVIGIGREHTKEQLAAFKKKKGFTFFIAPDPHRKIYKLFATKYVPRNILVDSRGKIVYQSEGFSEEEFHKLILKIQELLDHKSQTGTVKGTVIDSHNKPILDLQVVLKPEGYGDVADSSGYFVIKNIVPGIYTLEFSHIAFEKKIIKNVEISSNEVLNLNKITLRQRVIKLNRVVVTATRTNRCVTDVSYPINIVSEKSIIERNAKTTAEALREETGIFVQKTSHGGGSAIIRGLSSNQILILVDGIRLNNSTYRFGNHQYLTTIDNLSLQRIEVVRGPTSVLYGSDALGGTINVITKTPEISSSTSGNLNVNYSILSRYASADEEKTAGAEFSLSNSKFAFLTEFSHKNYGDLRRGANSRYPQLEKSTNGLKQTPTGFKAYDFDSKLVYAIASFQTLTLAYQMAKKIDVPRYDKYENSGYSRWVYQPQNRNLVYLIYKNKLQGKFVSSLRASLSYHRQEEGREIQKVITSPLTKEKDDVRTTGFTFQLNSLFREHSLTYGTEIYLDKVASERFYVDTRTGVSEKDIRGRYPDGAKYNSFGLFLQDEITLTQKWKAIAGLRFSYFATHFTIPTEPAATIQFGKIKQNFHSLTGSLGLIRKFNDKIFFNANIAQAFRAPNLSDISKLGESKGETYEVPNTNLKSEKMLSLDSGFKLDFSRLKGSISFYYSRISGLLASAPSTYNGSSTIEINGTTYKVKTKKNIGNAFIRGTEIEINYYLMPKLVFLFNLTSTYGQNTTANEPVGGIPPTFGLMGLEWRGKNFYLYFYSRFARKQNRLSQDNKDDPRIPPGGTPGWQTVNFRTAFNVKNWGNIEFAVENIFDINYRQHISGINGPGRNFILSFKIGGKQNA